MKLKDKCALVTGASSGLGAAIVQRFVEEGAQVFFTYTKDEAGALLTKDRAEAAGGKVWMAQTDLSLDGAIEKLVQESLDKLKKIDVLVNNAGVFIDQPFFDITPQAFALTYKVNLEAQFFLAQWIAKEMIRQNLKGRIINITSGGTIRTEGVCASYAAVKGGLNTLTKAMAVELGQYGITVNGILPGPVRTKLNDHQFVNDETRAMLLSSLKIKEFGKAEYIAEAALYYASNEACWTTGTLLSVDGGFASS